jgi:hypothetical protein
MMFDRLLCFDADTAFAQTLQHAQASRVLLDQIRRLDLQQIAQFTRRQHKI